MPSSPLPARKRSRISSGRARTFSVPMRPGRMELAVIPSDTFSDAMFFAIPSSPAFDAQ